MQHTVLPPFRSRKLLLRWD